MFPDYFKILIAFSGKSAFTVNLVKNVRKYKEEKEKTQEIALTPGITTSYLLPIMFIFIILQRQ